MKRVYEFTLPSSKEVENTSVRIENGKVFVEVEMKEKLQPKDGDFLATGSGSIFIYNPHYKSAYVPFYVGINAHGQICVHEDGENTGFSILSDCRYATNKEKSAFLERIEKEFGKRWNPEAKELEDIRWRAEYGDEYFYVGFDYIVRNRIDERQVSANENYRNHNYFRTFESAQKVADQIKEIFKNSKAE